MCNRCAATEGSTPVDWTPNEDVCDSLEVLDYLRLALRQVNRDEGYPLRVLVGEHERDDFRVQLDVYRLTLQPYVNIVTTEVIDENRHTFWIRRTTPSFSESYKKARPGRLLVPQHLTNTSFGIKFGFQMVVGDSDLMMIDAGPTNDGIVS